MKPTERTVRQQIYRLVTPRRLTAAERVGLADEARRVLARNRRSGVSAWEGRHYDFVCPSPSHYPFQWLWDSCFHAIALCHVAPVLAAQELRGVVAAAQPDGFLPHMTLWERDAHLDALTGFNIRLGGPYWTATTQPPILALALARVWKATGDRGLLDDVLPPTLAYYRWLAEHRDPDDDGLISILQPDESGLDACPKYDALMALPTLDAAGLRSGMQRLFGAYTPLPNDPTRLRLDLFDVEDVLVNTLYAAGLGALGRLLRATGGSRHEIDAVDTRRRRVVEALLTTCWDPVAGAFWDVAGSDERPQRVLTVTSLAPLILPELPAPIARALVERHLLATDEFWLPFPVPSVAASEPSFDPDFSTGLIWRGPTWVNTNWLLVQGLRCHGFDEIAAELTERTLAMVARGGFREFFNPYTAEGYGAASFGWTTLVLDLLAPGGAETHC
ncbi:MAG: hypothetical protein IT305_31805 [Chloroflexi bacterium]|nr:hypothetical protein [Chloroflexota bacterium]